MRRIAIISIILIILFISLSFVSAEDSLENASLTTNDIDVGISQDSTTNENNFSIDGTLSFKESNNILQDAKEISVDDSNYNDYFTSATGKFKNEVDVSKINTLKIGNVSDKLFSINKPLNIMPVSSDCQMTNSVIHLIGGSDGSNITDLKIINDKGEIKSNGAAVCKLHGIWFTNSSYNYVYNNTIRIAEEEGCYAMPMGWSSYNRIFNNNLFTYFTCCMIMGECNYNNISYNRMEIATSKSMVGANCIYFNPYGHADYIGVGDCIGNYIFSNYIKSNSNDVWSYAIAIESESNDTQIINNTIIGGYYGVIAKALSENNQPHNITIKENTIKNSIISIQATSNSVSISENRIMGSAGSNGIVVDDSIGGNATVFDNIIEYDVLSTGISVGAGNAKVFNNVVRLSEGVGAAISGNHISFYNNTIDVKGNEGIAVNGNDNLITNNFISSKGDGVVLSVVDEYNKIYNNTISFNEIYSDGYAVVMNGYVFATKVNDNIIETNSSEAFYVNIKDTVKDKDHGKIFDNTVNGIIEDTDTIIINDDNFYDYFDEEGYLKYEFNATEKRMLFLTFLSNKNLYFTDQIVLTSNKQSNLLYDVTITFSGNASNSSISDFKFYNSDKSSIILDGVENVDIKNNQFTTIASNIQNISVISVMGGCNDSNIIGNDIFITSNADYAYAILISEPDSKNRKEFSSEFTISNNTIFIKSVGVGEGIHADALIDSTISSNDISLICDDSAYGIAIAEVFERPHNIKIDSNEIIVNSKEMSYLIEMNGADSIEITNNYLKGVSNGIYGVAVFDSTEIGINKNEIVVVGKNLTEKHIYDELGKGNAAIHVYGTSKVKGLSQNVIDADACEILTKDSSSIISDFDTNYFVIAPYNYDLYFNQENRLDNPHVKESDVILFKNFTDYKTMNIDFPILIKPYKHLNQFTSHLILSGNYSNLNVSGFKFINAKLELDNVSNVIITNSSFVSSYINDYHGINNGVIDNAFVFKQGGVVFENSLNANFAYNRVTVNSSQAYIILIKNSNGTIIFNNIFDVCGGLFNLMTSNSSTNNDISFNVIAINSTGDIHAYNALNTSSDNFLNNNIDVYGDSTKSVVYYGDSSSDNNVMYNRIISTSLDGDDYCVVVDSIGNVISNNYLISSNGCRQGDDAVNACSNIVCNNTPKYLYVSANLSESGNGSLESPYSTIAEALQNAITGSTICLLPGCYSESNLVIDKMITLKAINQDGDTYINALNNRLFKITETGSLTVYGLKIYNGFSVDGGGLFYNKGSLIINNSMLYNSSSYYDNSNPTFTADKYVENVWHSYDCSNLGLGGAILNYGDLIIDSSNLFDNYAHKGGALADFGKTTIKNSLFYNNTGVHGGAIFTDSNEEFNIEDSYFHDNLAITTLDHCSIQKISSDGGNSYRYESECDMACGSGGAIFSDSPLVIKNSLFERNIAKCGGAIATDSNMEDYYGIDDVNYRSYGLHHKYAETTLSIEDSIFRYNEAKDTRCGNSTLLTSPDEIDYFNRFFEGGAIFGSFMELNIHDSLFEHNVAHGDGGALAVQCEDSIIEGCGFYNNTAGSYGGALSLYGDIDVSNTEIMGNSANGGGAIHYASYSVNNLAMPNKMNMANVTVANNVALAHGGAFLLQEASFSITNSNIYGNKAAYGDTLGSKSGNGISRIDARNNWWGSSDGPDGSIRHASVIRYDPWVSEKIKKDSGSTTPSNDDNVGGNGKTNRNSYTLPTDSKTGNNIRTGSTLTPGFESGNGNSQGYDFSGNWPNSGGSNLGGNGQNSAGFKLPGNWHNYSGGNERKGAEDTSDNGKTQIKGNAVNHNSMSKVNSSSVNSLDSIGMVANAADSSPSAQSSSGEDGDGSDLGKAYEITKQIDIDELDFSSSIYFILFIILWLMFVIGFYRKYDSEG